MSRRDWYTTSFAVLNLKDVTTSDDMKYSIMIRTVDSSFVLVLYSITVIATTRVPLSIHLHA